MNDLILSQIPLPATNELERQQAAIVALVELQQSVILALASVTGVTNQQELTLATQAGVEGRKFVKGMGECRLATTKRCRDFITTVNDFAEGLAAPVDEEMKRIGKHIALFRQQEDERVRLAEAARQREIAAAQAIADEAARKLREQEAAITNEADLQRAIEAEAQAKAKKAALRAAIVTTPPEVARSAGSTVRKVMQYEVTDILALFAARPELCRLEVNAAAIRATVMVGMIVPGLRIWEATEGGFRAR